MKSLKLLVVLSSMAHLFVLSLSAEINLRELILSRGENPVSCVSGGGDDATAHSGTSVPAKVFDGITHGGNAQRWMAKICKNAYLRFAIPESIGSVKIGAYKLWRYTGDCDTGRIPLAWELRGVTTSGVTNFIQGCESAVWDTINQSGVGESKRFEVCNDDSDYVEFIWKPTNSGEYKNDKSDRLSVGLGEFEIFVKEECDAKIGVSLWDVINGKGSTGDIEVFGGPSVTSHGPNNPATSVFDGRKELRVDTDRWLACIYAYDGCEKTGNAYVDITVPTSVGSLRPTGLRMWRHSIRFGGEVSFQRSPYTWKLYGVRDNGTLVLLHEQAEKYLYWNHRIYQQIKEREAYPSEEIRFEAKENFRKYRFVPLSSRRMELNIELEEAWKEDSTKPKPSVSSDVGLAELEIFVEWPRIPRGTVIIIR